MQCDKLQIHLTDALPCPFCASQRIVKGDRYFAMCVDCGATGPERNADATQGKFTRDWNTRPVPSAKEAELTDELHKVISHAVHPLLPDPMAMNDLYYAVDRVFEAIRHYLKS